MNKKLLLVVVLFFTFLTSYGQCVFGGTQSGVTQSICYNREVSGTNVGGVTISGVRLNRHVRVNVIQGLTYTITTANNNHGFIKRISLYNSTDTFIVQANAPSNNSSATITNWVATFTGALRIQYNESGNCNNGSSGFNVDITVTYTGGSNSVDSQTAFGNDTWVGHVYDFSDAVGVPPSDANAFANYLGYITIPTENFVNDYGGSDVCASYTAIGTSATFRTDTYAVRYRMRTSKTGCYWVNVRGDDGVRLTIAGVKIFDRWVQESPTSYDKILVNLTAGDELLFEYYEKNGGNISDFTMTAFDATSNTITAPTQVVYCSNSAVSEIDGSLFYGYDTDGTTELSNPTIKFQWQISTDGSPYINIASNSTSRKYTPVALTNATGVNIVRKYKRLASAIAASASSCAFNESNEVTITTSTGIPAVPGAITGTTTQCPSTTGQVYSIGAVTNATTYNWTVPTGWSITGGAGTTSVTVTTGTAGQNGNISVTAGNGCGTSAARTLAVTVAAASIGGTVSGSNTVCTGTNSTPFTLSGQSGSILRWESSTDNFATAGTSIANTTTSHTAANLTTTTYYRAVVQNGGCSIVYSSIGTVTVNGPTTTGVSICVGGTGMLTATTNVTSGTTLSGVWTAGTDPTALRPNDSMANSGTCNFHASSNRNYVAISFQVTVTGAYTFEMNANTGYDGMGYITSGAFVPGNCAGSGSWVRGDDDSSAAGDEPLMTATLTAGTTYTLISTTYSASSGTYSGGFAWTVTPPAGGAITPMVNWYKVATGGTPIGYGSPFNPVGVAGSGLANTNTTGTTIYYAANPSDTSCRVVTNFVINALPSVPTVGTITQPTCVVPTGSVVLSGLPSSGTWTLTRAPGAVTTTGTGTTTTISGLPAGTYTYTVSNGTCTSLASANAVVTPLITNTWNGSAWSNGTPLITDSIVFAGNYSLSGSLNGCSCTVNSGVTVTIASGDTLKLENGLDVVGTGALTFNNNASLVQVNNVVNTGSITYKRQTTPVGKFDYTYWSSPVAGQTLYNVSPTTLSDKYLSLDVAAGIWVEELPSEVMEVGVGYIIRGPQENDGFAAPYQASFVGIPNNGDIAINGIIADKSYLIGNPYPSALDADAFLLANVGVLDGTLYFWTHNTPISPSGDEYVYEDSDFASYNGVGGTATAATISPGFNSYLPSGKIAAGQSFFGSSIVGAGTQIVFNNSMRLDAGGVVLDNSQFFKFKAKSKSTKTIEKSRIWLNLTNPDGVFKQMLVGYVTGATNDYETTFDGVSFDGSGFVDFYSINQDKNLVIQGRALPFETTDEVPLGFTTRIPEDFERTANKNFTISIDHTDGVLANQEVLLEDKDKNVTHNLSKDGGYAFTTELGTFNERFVLRYLETKLSNPDFDKKDKKVIVSVKNHQIKINSFDETIAEVLIFDLQGRQIYQKKKVNSNEFSILNLGSSNQVLIVKILLQNGRKVTEKLIFK